MSGSREGHAPFHFCTRFERYVDEGGEKNGGLLQLAAKVEVTLLSAHAQSDLKRMSLKQEMLSLCSLAGLSHEGVSVFCVS